MLSSSGSAQPGAIWSLHAHGTLGDFMVVFGDVVSPGVFFPGFGNLTVNPLSASVFTVAPGTLVPVSGQLSWSAVIPPATGWSASFQAVQVTPAPLPAAQISEVVTLTIL